MRTFFVVQRPVPTEPCGGGGGVNYRLMMAQKRYHHFENAYFIYSDVLISANTGERLRLLQDEHQFDINKTKEIYSVLNTHFRFNDEDVFVFQDIHSFYAMRETIGDMKRSIVVYHQQGSMYYEGLAHGLSPDKDRKEQLDYLTRYAIENSSIFAFPSYGGKQALIDTLPDAALWLNKKKTIILYNGCSPSVTPEVDSDEQSIMDFLERIQGDIFISVAVLNEAKGVERLPDFFKRYDKIHFGKDWMWVIVGSGVKADSLSEGIKGLEGHILWIQEHIPNDLILRMYEKADFYIMAHRYSIFDFATIEAMHMGCIPVLSDVGGNREMLGYGNGYMLDDDLNSDLFCEWVRKKDIQQMKDINRNVAREIFSEQSMLKRYLDAVSSMY